MEARGLPPVLHLVHFEPSRGAAAVSVATHGLDWFVGHELVLTCPPDFAPADALRRAARLAVDALVNGSLSGMGRIAGLDRGEWLDVGRAETGGDGAMTVGVALTPGRRR